jgi:NAD(P)-dependent dehydrogenase (short-subunit alcohol dehydrogenase family)
LIDETREVYGPVNILINNAALNYYIPIQDYPLNRWLRAFSVNVHAPFMLSQAVLPDMVENQSGSIVNISSGAAIGPGRGPYPNSAVRGGVMYGASKAALERFTQGLAEEVFSNGISVTALSPSQVVPTPGTIYHKLVEGLDDPRGESPMLMAKATLLLASEAPEIISGRVTYSQEILKEFGWITDGQGRGIDTSGSGYSQI